MTNEQIEREITNIAKVEFNNFQGEYIADRLSELKKYILGIKFEADRIYLLTTKKHLPKFLVSEVNSDEVGYWSEDESYGYGDGQMKVIFGKLSKNDVVIRLWWD